MVSNKCDETSDHKSPMVRRILKVREPSSLDTKSKISKRIPMKK